MVAMADGMWVSLHLGKSVPAFTSRLLETLGP